MIRSIFSGVERTILWFLKILREAMRRFILDGCFNLSAALSFYTLLSLIPALALLVSGVGYLLGSSEDAAEIVAKYLEKIIPQASDFIYNGMKRLIADKELTGGIGVIMLIWVALSLFSSLESSVNFILRFPSRYGMFKGFLRQNLVGLVAMAVFGFLLLFSTALTMFLSILERISWNIGGVYIPLGGFWKAFDLMVSFALTLFVFFGIYKFMARGKVPWRNSAIGAIVAGISWEIAKRAFTFYVVHMSNYARIYGPITTVVIFVIWVYLSATILLLGAEVVAILGESDHKL